MRYRPEKPLHVNPFCSELFSNHTHKHASVMPNPQSFTRNTDENRDILENFTSVVSFFKLKFAKNKNWSHPVAWTC